MAASTTLSAVGAFIAGLVVAGFLIIAVRVGMRSLRRESRRPRRDEQPQPPPSGPVYESREVREPDEVPLAKDESERLMPYELHPSGSKRSKNQKPRRWRRGSSGSFGSGGPGST
ncbi:DUF6479 family protein [Streptomyces sp. NPDC001661]